MLKNKDYCYKVKFNIIKTKQKNVYSQAKIEEFGFFPMFGESNEEEKENVFLGGWAKPILLPYTSEFARWVRRNIEYIYKAEKKKEQETKQESSWLKEIYENGYEFDEDGKLVENEKVCNPVEAQLCVMNSDPYKGVIFINVSGAIELYDSNVLDETCPEEIQFLKEHKVIYRKQFKE